MKSAYLEVLRETAHKLLFFTGLDPEANFATTFEQIKTTLEKTMET